MRKTLGYFLLAASFAPWIAIPALPLLDLPVAEAATIGSIFFIGGQIAFLASIVLLGRGAWERIKSLFKRR